MNDNTNNLNMPPRHLPISNHLLRAYETFRDHLYLLGSESITEEQLDQLYNTFVHITCAGKTVSIPFDATIYNILVYLIETMIKEF